MSNSLEVLKRLQQDPANSVCFDCGAPSPLWVSMSHSTFICTDCSTQHRSLGASVSYVRSVPMDEWSQGQLKVMSIGGNQRLKEYFDGYNLGKGLSIAYKYTTAAARYYRDMLKSETEGQPLTARKPSPDEGRQSLIERYEPAPRPNIPPNYDLSSLLPDPEPPRTWWQSAKHVLGTAAGKLPSFGVTGKIKNAAGFIYEKTVKMGGAAFDVGSEYMVRRYIAHCS